MIDLAKRRKSLRKASQRWRANCKRLKVCYQCGKDAKGKSRCPKCVLAYSMKRSPHLYRKAA